MHQSSIDPTRKNQSNMTTRATLHKWNLNRYCHPRTGETMDKGARRR